MDGMLSSVLSAPLAGAVPHPFRTGTSMTKYATFSRTPRSVRQWTNREIAEELGDLPNVLVSRFPRDEIRRYHLTSFIEEICSEESVNVPCAYACDFASNCAVGFQLLSATLSGRYMHGKPDHAWVDSRFNCMVKGVCEGKCDWCIPSEDVGTLDELWSANLQTPEKYSSVYHLIRQVYGYTVINSVRYAVISTYNRWWLCRRHDNGEFAISREMRFNSTNPTVLQRLASLSLAMAEPPSSRRVPRWYCNFPARSSSAPCSPVDNIPGTPPQPGRAPGAGSRTSSRKRSRPSSSSGLIDHGDLVGLPIDELADVHIIGAGQHGAVFRCQMPDGVWAVVKEGDIMASPQCRAQLQHESMVYNRLCDLQGRSIPELIFDLPVVLYRGVLEGIVMCDVGMDAVDPEFICHIAYGVRLQLLQALESIHRAGVLHSDIAARNVVYCIDPERLMIVDFGDAILDASGHSVWGTNDAELERKQLAALLALDRSTPTFVPRPVQGHQLWKTLAGRCRALLLQDKRIFSRCTVPAPLRDMVVYEALARARDELQRLVESGALSKTKAMQAPESVVKDLLRHPSIVQLFE
ncbi:Protein kinase domain-containing protein [Plasmodiophora brassicae]|uniref:Protein kinase domain-containing protein n=1 Tax=Plasmodiophora brassicae TaxID=37360 RepID=A0A0G4J4F5_PLABS|nr:hypothetical protein PBRA_009107 [Plasmodiophora brassicae]